MKLKNLSGNTFLTGILTTIFLFAGISPAVGQTSKVKPYKVSPTLAEVQNLRAFNKNIPLSIAQKKLLAQNLFVVSPSDSKQLFHIYEDNDYKDIPTFVTTDSILHLYHIFFDFTLRTVEEQTLTPVLENLTKGMLADSVKTWNEVEDARLKQAALKNVAYFAVAARILEIDAQVPAETQNLISLELDLIEKHEGFAVGAIFPYRLDYSQFVPRGHYTRTETLQKFFRAMMWYGLAPFALETNEGRADETIRQSLLLTRSLYRADLENDWETIYEPTAFYVGAADDVTPAEWKSLADSVFGANFSPAAINDSEKFDAFAEAAKKLRPAKIQFKNLVAANQPASADPNVQFRFMGQRYIPDSEIMQRLVEPLKRVFPSGLDVMTVLGSERAAAILDANPKLYNPNNWTEYKSERTKLINEFSKVKKDKWTSNLYWSWLYALQPLLEPAPAGFRHSCKMPLGETNL